MWNYESDWHEVESLLVLIERCETIIPMDLREAESLHVLMEQCETVILAEWCEVMCNYVVCIVWVMIILYIRELTQFYS